MSEQTASLCTTDAAESLREIVERQVREIERLLLNIAEYNEHERCYQSEIAALKAQSGGVVLDDDALSDLASSACQEALAFGVGDDSFMRLARTVRDRCARLNSPPVSAGDDAQYPPCDYCAEPLSYHPWHGSGLINGVESRHIHACDKCRRLLPAVSDGEYGDAYQGAREDLAIWKRRALEAEAKIREQDQIIENLGNALNAESGPTFMGEPVMPVSAGDDRKLSDIGNELHNLSCHVVHHNEGWANQLGTLASELWYWPSNAGVVDERAHPDEIAVDRFAVAMKEKLAKSREKGRHGWQNATQPHLSSLLYGHMYKADPLDVANLAMMLHQNGQAIELPWHARLNPHFKIPLGWRAQKTDGGDGFIVSSPRVNGVASNTAVFVDSPCPAHRMLFDVLAALTASAPSHGEQVRHMVPEPVRDALARRCLWLAFCWNDHNFGPAHEEARKEALKHGIDSFDAANEWLAASPSAVSQKGGE